MSLTARQAIALEHPCASGPEVMNQRFWRSREERGVLLSTIVTVNK